MKRLLLGLLKLLLQLLIFAVAGKWVRIGDPQPKPSARKPAKQQRPQRKPPTLPAQAGRGPLFERKPRRRGPYEDVREPAREWRSVEQAEVQEYEPRSIEALVRGDGPRPKRGKRPRRGDGAAPERRGKPAAGELLPRSSDRAGSLASALRDPARVRAALVLGAALGPRRPRR